MPPKLNPAYLRRVEKAVADLNAERAIQTGDKLLTAADLAVRLGLKGARGAKTVLSLPLPRITINPRNIRFRWPEVLSYLVGNCRASRPTIPASCISTSPRS